MTVEPLLIFTDIAFVLLYDKCKLRDIKLVQLLNYESKSSTFSWVLVALLALYIQRILNSPAQVPGPADTCGSTAESLLIYSEGRESQVDHFTRPIHPTHFERP